MPKINNSVDFIDNDDQGNLIQSDDDKAKHKRAEVAHKLAVVLLFDQKAQHHKKNKQKPDSAKRISVKRGALEEVE